MQSHARLQNALAEQATLQGFEVKRPDVGDPQWDVLWCDGAATWVAEVKSITDANEERQLRLGLGQLLRYRHRLSASGQAAHEPHRHDRVQDESAQGN